MSDSDHPDGVRYPTGSKVWSRLEPLSRNAELTASLRAAVYDPMWLLGRQWQIGEFSGEDAGSPVDARIELTHDTVTRVQLGETSPMAYDHHSDGPLEALVEREAVTTDDVAPGARQRAEAGQHFLRLLAEAGVDADVSDFPSQFHLQAPEEPLDAADARYISLVAGRVLDGHTLVEAIETGDLSSPAGVDSETFATVVDRFATWYRELYDEPADPSAEAWDPERFEYRFRVATGEGDRETVFAADEYRGGRLDWDAFSPAGGFSLTDDEMDGDLTTSERTTSERTTSETAASAERASTQVTTIRRLPTPIDFPGMPAPRWWQFEDSSVDLEELSAAPEGLSRLLMLEFVLVYGNDWFMVPIETPVGSLSRVRSLEITDTFGVTTGEDTPVAPADDGWNMFMADLSPADDDASKGLFLPPVLGAVSESDPVEEVLLARDEMANLAFAVEERIESPVGSPVERDTVHRPLLTIASLRPAADATAEAIVLENIGSTELDTTGWRLQLVDESGVVEPGYALDGLTVPPSASVTVVTGTDPAGDAEADRYLGEAAPILTEPNVHLVVRNPDGRVADRAQIPSAAGAHLPTYRLGTAVPDHWFPLKPTGPDGEREYRYELARLLDVDALDVDVADIPTPAGRILTDSVGSGDDPVSIYEEEVTRAGVSLTRSYQLARWLGGTTHLWSGRRAQVGRGEGSSGLRFDLFEE